MTVCHKQIVMNESRKSYFIGFVYWRFEAVCVVIFDICKVCVSLLESIDGCLGMFSLVTDKQRKRGVILRCFTELQINYKLCEIQQSM